MKKKELQERFRFFWPVLAKLPYEKDGIQQEVFGYVVNWEDDWIKIQTDPHLDDKKLWVRAENVRQAWQVGGGTLATEFHFPERG